MKVRRKSPICIAIPATDGQIRYKGKVLKIPCKYIIHLPDGGDVPVQSLDGFDPIGHDSNGNLLVQQIYPVEECVEYTTHGVMKNHAGHHQDHKPGDCRIGNPGCEIRRLKEDMHLYEVVEP